MEMKTRLPWHAIRNLKCVVPQNGSGGKHILVVKMGLVLSMIHVCIYKCTSIGDCIIYTCISIGDWHQ